ncbi:ATP-binding protein [Methylobacterium sp. WL19]|uniref:ATP-binding protein n=1 Tax=Methylobacterium sp. WL19 TaxID=2603896 RepID=UPI0011C87A6F|nr:ATP-binding protein [Methylobacterium sp. WL19]TXN26209.1 HAMP domain-containing protein [Methylobacterium sp. WL19]
MSTEGKDRWRRLVGTPPRSIAGQIAVLSVAAIVVSHAVATLAFFLLREPWNPDNHPGVAATRLATIVRLLDAAPPGDRLRLLQDAARSLPSLQIETAPASPEPPSASTRSERPDHPMVKRMREGFGRPLTITDLSPPGRKEPGGGTRIGILTPSGASLRATLPDDDRPPFGPGPIVFTFVLLGITLSLMSIWATRALTAPLAKLAEAADAFGTGMNLVALPRNGPKEVAAVSRALDTMRGRVRRLIDDRTQMLAAISHDLRTPITRLRLRAEFIEDDHARTMTLRDLDQMNGLVEAALSFIRDGQAGGAHSLVDLASLVQTVCDGFTDVGADVRLEQTRHVLVRGRADDLQRAIVNLVDNAVKYGGSARLTIHPSEQGVALEVSDDGPGIPEAERDAMVQPFVRGDRTRNLDEASGFGLGLSIVLAIVEGHGGRLSLSNKAPRGLVARIDLPLAVAQATPPRAAPMPNHGAALPAAP